MPKKQDGVPVIEGVTKILDDLAEYNREVAEELEKLPKFMGDRGFQIPHRNFLSEEMKNGRFLGDLTHIITCMLGKNEINLNLKHSNSAALQQDAGWKAPGLARKIIYRAKNEDALRSIYSIVDGGKGRTFGDRVVAATYGKKEFEGITKTDILKLLPGYRFFVGHTASAKNVTISSHVVSDGMLDDHLEACLAIKDLAQAYTTDRSWRWQAYVVYAMFMTYKHHKKDFHEFWTPVLRRDLPLQEGWDLQGESDPRARLTELLTLRKLGANGEKIGLAKMKICCLWAYIRWARDEKIAKLSAFSSAQKMSTKGEHSIFEQFKNPEISTK